MSGKNQRKAGGPPQKDINVELARWKKWLEEAGKSPISPIHVEELEKRFRITDSPDANLTKKIANQIGVDVRLVQYWFSHQRALHVSFF
uniref:Homeobox domain-containing protein n=1 Tax=Caenorhabditis tropicalis TaxID=1561998 RepID=A0A1I7UH65_9PELO